MASRYWAGSARSASALGPALAACVALAIIIATAACSAKVASSCPDGAEQWVKYELFMGRGGPSGEVVDDASWDSFLSEEVTSRFPDGLSVIDAYGQWRNPDATIEKELSKLLVILAPPGDTSSGLMNEVANEYKERFRQEAVLKVTSETCVEFL